MERTAPARSRSRSPEQWDKVPEDDSMPAVIDPQNETMHSGARVAGGMLMQCPTVPSPHAQSSPEALKGSS